MFNRLFWYGLVLICGFAGNVASLQAQNFDEIVKATAFDRQEDDQFGRSVDLTSNVGVVGADFEDELGNNAGAAYIFSQDISGVGFVKKVQGNDTQAGDLFGSSVNVSGDMIIIGAIGHNLVSGTIPINQGGAAYIFDRNQGGADNWGEIAKLVPDDPQNNSFFGASVAISGDFAVVGAPLVNLLNGSTTEADAGAAYIFFRNQGGTNNWGQVKKLVASDFDDMDRFGTSVAISGDLVVIGSPGQDFTGANQAGSAYIFDRNNGGTDNWGEVTQISASDGSTSCEFGSSVDIEGDIIVAGSPCGLGGGAYVYYQDQGGMDNWGEVTKMISDDLSLGDELGISVALSGDAIIVGADGEDEVADGAGAAYLFLRNEGGADNWGQIQKFIPSDGGMDDKFGGSVGIFGDFSFVGSLNHDGGLSNAGAAYLFGPTCEISAVTPTVPVCNGTTAEFQLAYAGTILATTQTVILDSDALGLTAGTIVATGTTSPISIAIPNQLDPGTVTFRIQDADDAACSATFDVTFTGCVTIPTMGEWALIFMGLFLLTLFAVFTTVLALSTALTNGVSSFSFRQWPFELSTYVKRWLQVVLVIGLLFTIAILGLGYTLTSADPIGAAMCSFVAAYWLYLITK